jgi:hypothetical protein
VQTGAATGGFLRLAILYVIFCCVAAFVIESWVRQWKQAGIVKTFVENPHPISMTVVLAVNTCIGLCFAYLIYVGISKGFPLFTGADRFMFRLDIEDPVFNAIMVNRSVAVFYLGVMSAILRRGQLYNLLFIAVMVISALFGEKFTSIIILLAIFSMPMLLRRNWAFRQLHLKNVFVSLFIATCISLPLIFIAYKGLDNPGNAIKKFTERVALQGQLWYMADKGTHDLFHFDGAALSNDLRTIINPDYETYKYSHFPYVPYPYEGMRYLMIKYAPPDYVYQAFENHVAFAMGMHAYWLATTGWVGAFILNIVFAMFAGAILSILLFAIISTRPLLLLLAARLFIAWFGFQNLGDFYLIFNKNALITFVLFYILQAYDKKKYFKHQRI